MAVLRIALLVVAFGMLSVGGAAHAQQAVISEADRDAGMARAPALISKLAMPCTLTAARKFTPADRPGDFFEVACEEGIGFVLIDSGAGEVAALNCLEAGRPLPSGAASPLRCELPGASVTRAELAPLVFAAGVRCQTTRVRGAGSTEVRAAIELACSEGGGYILVAGRFLDVTKKVEAHKCSAVGEAGVDIGGGLPKISCILSGAGAQAAFGPEVAAVAAIARSAGLECLIDSARELGVAKARSGKGMPATSYYEASCRRGIGFILVAPEGRKPLAIHCLEAARLKASGKLNVACRLPSSSYTQAEIAPLIRSAKIRCASIRVRSVGESKGRNLLEVACRGGAGYIVAADPTLDPARGALAYNCLAFDDAASGIKCTLSERSVRLAVVDRIAADSGVACSVSGRRYAGAATDGAKFYEFYEAGCAQGRGYMFKIEAATASLVDAIPCAQAGGIFGGCKIRSSAPLARE